MDEVAAGDRQRREQLASVVRHGAREVGDGQRRGDRGAKCGLVVVRVRFRHGEAHYTHRASAHTSDLAALDWHVRSRPAGARTMCPYAGRGTNWIVPEARHRASHFFHVGILLVGATGLGFAIDQLGTDGMSRVLATGWWFALIALIDLVGTLFDALGIYAFIRPKQEVSYWAVFAAQSSGLAVNRLTPGNSLGEPVKVTMLRTHAVPTSLAVSAVVMFNLVTMYVGIAVIVIGVPITAVLIDLPHEVTIVVWGATALLVAVAVAVIFILRRGAVSTLIGMISSIRFLSRERAARWRKKIVDIDARLRDLLGSTRESGLRLGIVGVAGSRVLNWAGTMAVMHAADIPMRPSLVIAALSVGVIVTWASNIVPLGLGIADGANFVLYSVLGATPDAGLVFTMINRLRIVVLALIGLAIMAIAHSTHRVRLGRRVVAT